MKIINVMAASLDGKIALSATETDVDRRAYGFVNECDRAFVREQLEQADAVILGANSLRASGGVWVVRNRNGKLPIWVVLTRTGLDPNLRFWRQDDVPRWLASPAPIEIPAPFRDQVRNIFPKLSSDGFGVWLVEQLREVGVQTAVLFGGGEVNRLFYQARLVDELNLTLCPMILGTKEARSLVEPSLSGLVTLTLKASQVQGSHVFLKYTVHKS